MAEGAQGKRRDRPKVFYRKCDVDTDEVEGEDGRVVKNGRSASFWIPLRVFRCVIFPPEASRPFLALYGHGRELLESFCVPVEMDSECFRLS